MRYFIQFLLAIVLVLSVPLTYSQFDSAQINTQPLKLVRITPNGDNVPDKRQVVFQFNRAVVPVGKMQRESADIPITFKPALQCEWRWLNTSALACQLKYKHRLTMATRYTATVKPGIKAEDGSTLAKTVHHHFSTKRPSIAYQRFQRWLAPDVPVIRLSFNQPVTSASVAQHVYFDVGQRVALKVKPVNKKKGLEIPQRYWLVEPVQGLTLDKKVVLKTEAGIQSSLGQLTSIQQKTILSFHTFPDFQFLGIECGYGYGQTLLVDVGSSNRKSCNPLDSVALRFSVPVAVDDIKAHLKMLPDLAGGRTDYDPWANVYRYSKLKRIHRRGTEYKIWLPELLKAYQPYQIQSNIALADEFGRPLKQPIEFKFKTAHRQPTYNLLNKFSVLEKQVDTKLPLYVTNLDNITIDYQRLDGLSHEKQLNYQLDIPFVQDVSFKIPFKARELANGSAVVQGKFLTTPVIPSRHANDHWFFSQVTPFNVQVKMGHYNTMVWVTDLATGEPVSGVDVDIYLGRYQELTTHPNTLAVAVTNEQGIALLPGIQSLDPELQYQWVYQRDEPRLFVRARKQQDIALLPLTYPFTVEDYHPTGDYIATDTKARYGYVQAWGTTAQGVYKAGDTIQYKLYVRNQANKTLSAAPRQYYTLKIKDPTGKTVETVDKITLSEFGAYDAELKLNKNSAVGWYQFHLTASFNKDLRLRPLRVLVSDFTPAPFRVNVELNGKLFKSGDQVVVNSQATLHAGGPYTKAPIRVTASIKPRWFSPKTNISKGFEFGALDNSYTVSLQNIEQKLDNQGKHQLKFKLNNESVLYGDLLIESAVRDDRGKSIAKTTRAHFSGRDRFIGIKLDDWLLQQNKAVAAQLLVVDETGNAQAETEITVKIQHKFTKATRVKSVGNAYLTKYVHEWKQTNQCQLISSLKPQFCQFTPKYAGDYQLIASIKDSQGRHQQVKTQRWVVGKGHVLWESEAGYNLPIEAEKTTYKVGEQAKFLIKNPFPGAKALITLERYGVIKSWVETFKDSTHTLSIDITPELIPGFYISISLMSPRVDKPIKASVDLGKPTFRMGYLKLNVDDPYKQLKVDIKTDKPSYKPGQTVTLDLQVKTLQQQAVNEPVEFAVAVLDEAVLDLIQQGKHYFDPYQGFYRLQALDVRNFNLLKALIGQQKWEKKGASSGGDGGSGARMRSVFKFVSYWNPSLRTDKNGYSQVKFTAPDNLTGWRVLVLAVTPSDRLGLSDASFKVNQPTEIRPVMPNQVLVGDQFSAGFSVMNRTAKPRKLNIVLQQRTKQGKVLNQHQQLLTAPPYQRQTVWLPTKATQAGTLYFQAIAGDATDQDKLQHKLPVHKAHSFITAATYGTTMQPVIEEHLKIPTDIMPDAGAISLVTSPTVISGVDGAFKYMRDYPYVCWEQRLTKGVMASRFKQLSAYLDENITWAGHQALPTTLLSQAATFQASNGGMAYYQAQDRYVSPYLSAYTGLAFNWLKSDGYHIPKQVQSKLHQYLATLLRKDVVPTFYSPGMTSTVRAVALAALAPYDVITKQDVLRYQPHVQAMSLLGKAMFLQAAMDTKVDVKVQQQVAEDILAHADQSGGRFIFSETLDDAYTHLLHSPMRANCAILSAFVRFQQTPQGHALVADIPFKLTRTISQHRKREGYWQNTQENMFCMNALTDYHRVYETVKPNMQLTAKLNNMTFGTAEFKSLTAPMVTLSQPLKANDRGQDKTIRLEKEGSGRVYYSARLKYAPQLASLTAQNAGIEVQRQYSVERQGKMQLLTTPMQIKTGELVKVDLFLNLPAERYFVVVDDPVPGGLEPVNRDLATASTHDANKAKMPFAGGSLWYTYDDWQGYGFSHWSFYHKELRHHAVRFYSEFLAAGRYHLSYIAQAIAPGEFNVLPTHSEEMYDPDVYGKSLPAVLKVIRD